MSYVIPLQSFWCRESRTFGIRREETGLNRNDLYGPPALNAERDSQRFSIGLAHLGSGCRILPTY